MVCHPRLCQICQGPSGRQNILERWERQDGAEAGSTDLGAQEPATAV